VSGTTHVIHHYSLRKDDRLHSVILPKKLPLQQVIVRVFTCTWLWGVGGMPFEPSVPCRSGLRAQVRNNKRIWEAERQQSITRVRCGETPPSRQRYEQSTDHRSLLDVVGVACLMRVGCGYMSDPSLYCRHSSGLGVATRHFFTCISCVCNSVYSNSVVSRM
jgi:hypothetical protein